MFRRRTVICLFLSLLMAFIITGPAHAAAAPLAAPIGVTVSAEGTQFIVKWQNPSDVSVLAKSAYDNYNGMLDYIVDWRVNNGPWHYDEEVPGDQSITSYYPNIPFGFFGQVCGSSGEIVSPQAKISKVFVGVSYNTPIVEWLKKNNIEFRVKYIYGYWSENLEGDVNQYSGFSNIAFLGTLSPTGSSKPGPIIGEYGVLAPPSFVEAPQSLESEYMTLNLRWREPETIRTLVDLELLSPTAVIDWKLNNGEWHDGLREEKGIHQGDFQRFAWHMFPDKNGYVSTTLYRGALKIPPGMPLSSWLADKTYYFRVRYVLMIPEENALKEVISPYSNTVTLGRGTVPPKQLKQGSRTIASLP